MKHILKVAEPYFDALVDGSKTFEIRRNDRAFQRGDVLELVEGHEHSYGIDCRGASCPANPSYIHKVVTFVYSGDPRIRRNGGLEPGFVVMALADLSGKP